MFQCDAFQLDAFQNDCTPVAALPQRRRRVTVVVRPGRTPVQVLSPLEEWKREREPLTERDLQRALAEDEEFLLGFWD